MTSDIRQTRPLDQPENSISTGFLNGVRWDVYVELDRNRWE